MIRTARLRASCFQRTPSNLR